MAPLLSVKQAQHLIVLEAGIQVPCTGDGFSMGVIGSVAPSLDNPTFIAFLCVLERIPSASFSRQSHLKPKWTEVIYQLLRCLNKMMPSHRLVNIEHGTGLHVKKALNQGCLNGHCSNFQLSVGLGFGTCFSKVGYQLVIPCCLV